MTKKEENKNGSGETETSNSRSSPHPHLLSSVARSNSKASRAIATSSATATATTLYHPSIFRYTCTGRLKLDSRNGGQSKASSGVCHGIQSNLEHIDHWRLSTREEAIKQFEYKSAMGIGANGADSEDAYYNSGGGHSHSQDSGGSGASSAHAQQEQAVYLSNVLLYPPPPPPSSLPPTEGEDRNDEDDDDHDDDGNDEKNMKKNKNKKKETMISRKNTDGSTTITPQQENWSCYGSTEVDILVMRPQNAKDETIAGVASYCAPGITVRDLAISPTNIGIGSDAGGRERTTTIRLGILEIVYATVLEGFDDDDDNNKDRTKATNGENGNKQDDNDNDKNNNNKGKGETMKGWITAPTRVVSSGKKIIHHMNLNGQILYQSVQENYPTRTYEASQRITNEFAKTWDRTTGLMKKVVSVALFGGDWDDDNE